MNKNRIKKAFDDMNPEIIDAAAKNWCEKCLEKEAKMKSVNYRKRIVLIAAAAAFVIAAVMIPLAVMMNRAPNPDAQPPVATNSTESKAEKQTTPTDVQPATPTNVDQTKPTDEPVTPTNPTIPSDTQVKYVVYYAAAAGDVSVSSDDPAIPFVNGADKSFDSSSRTETQKPDDAELERSVSFGDQNYQLTLLKAYETPLAASLNFKEYSQYLSYRAEGVKAEFRQGTNELLFFSVTDAAMRTAEGEMTEDEIKPVAESIITSLYGEDVLNNYPLDQVVFTDTESGKYYSLVYRKSVWGVHTNDAIQISINLKGEVIAVNAKMLGVYSGTESDVSKEEIINATNALNNALPDSWSIHSTEVIIDSLGDYYLKVQASKTVDGEINAVEFYINIR